MSDVNTTATPAQAPATAPARPIQDLREWLARVDEIGELVRVSGAVDPTRR